MRMPKLNVETVVSLFNDLYNYIDTNELNKNGVKFNLHVLKVNFVELKIFGQNFKIKL